MRKLGKNEGNKYAIDLQTSALSWNFCRILNNMKPRKI
jgi:hypothetical protein